MTRHLDAVIDLHLKIIDLRIDMNARMDGIDADAAALEMHVGPDADRCRRAREHNLLADTVALRDWRAQWLARLEPHYRALYAALDAPPITHA